MINGKINVINSMIAYQLKSNPLLRINDELIKNTISQCKIMLPSINKDEEDIIFNTLKERHITRMSGGAYVKNDNHKSWYLNAKKTINPRFWNRYKTYLSEDLGFSYNVIDTLDDTTDKILDLLGNPEDEYFDRKGLIIGDVQSGKTATYTAIINKAADAGYKIVILLTGTIEKLRSQTQSRLDEGFLGFDSNVIESGKKFVGVGRQDDSISGVSVTTTTADFVTKTAKGLGLRLSHLSAPILLVVKKNKAILEKLEKWLKTHNAHNGSRITEPMLLIDDESDNASVNTKTDDVTAINQGIRKLLVLFERSNYVAFTATPYANIFIDPESEDEMLSSDLFPEDFIYALDAPSNYIGARNIFPENSKYHRQLKSNDDCEKFIPQKHKKDFIPGELPKTLKDAILSFLIINTMRDLRKDEKKHRSMLINVSRFTDVQDCIRKDVDRFIKRYKRAIENYALTTDPLLNKEIKDIYNVYQEHFSHLEFEWEDILLNLSKSIISITTRSINQRNASSHLDYSANPNGLRVIAVGGLSLSRGLTLEGLCVSYFYRSSKTYDTLLQMGRWFGYRPNYADLCQIWMTENSMDWYAYISESTDELRRDVKRMQDANSTPKDFGLRVRSDKTTLMVTAMNKMRNTEKVIVDISLDGRVIETPFIHNDRAINQRNYELVKNWLSEVLITNPLILGEKISDYATTKPQLSGVSKHKIVELLSEYESHKFNMHFNTDTIKELLKEYKDGSMDNWDILIASGRNEECIQLAGITLKPIQRKFGINKTAVQMSGSKSRLGSSNDGIGGLTKEEKEHIENKIRSSRSEYELDKSFSQEDYFKSGIKRNPLLVIYPIKLKFDDVKENTASCVYDKDDLLIGLSIGIPRIDGKKEGRKARYVLNPIAIRELNDEYDLDSLDDEINE